MKIGLQWRSVEPLTVTLLAVLAGGGALLFVLMRRPALSIVIATGDPPSLVRATEVSLFTAWAQGAVHHIAVDDPQTGSVALVRFVEGPLYRIDGATSVRPNVLDFYHGQSRDTFPLAPLLDPGVEPDTLLPGVITKVSTESAPFSDTIYPPLLEEERYIISGDDSVWIMVELARVSEISWLAARAFMATQIDSLSASLSPSSRFAFHQFPTISREPLPSFLALAEFEVIAPETGYIWLQSDGDRASIEFSLQGAESLEVETGPGDTLKVALGAAPFRTMSRSAAKVYPLGYSANARTTTKGNFTFEARTRAVIVGGENLIPRAYTYIPEGLLAGIVVAYLSGLATLAGWKIKRSASGAEAA